MAAKSNGHLKSKIKKIYKRDKHIIVKTAKDAKDKFIDAEESVEKYAKDHPWKTIGFSLLAGAVAARILHFRKKNIE